VPLDWIVSFWEMGSFDISKNNIGKINDLLIKQKNKKQNKMQRTAESNKHLGIPRPTIICMDTEPPTANHLCRSLSDFVCF
jgi:hypothetical protein